MTQQLLGKLGLALKATLLRRWCVSVTCGGESHAFC